MYVTTEYKEWAKDLVNALKFKSMRQASTPIARIMAEQLPYFDRVTLIVPLPTAPKRVRQRGFDHTGYIAREISKITNLKYLKILRKTDNRRQVGATRKQRLIQAKESYTVIKPKDVRGRDILLVDDVATTGASLGAAVRALKDAGAKSVRAAVFSYTK